VVKNVALIVDGEARVVSDEDGMALLALVEPPESFGIECAGWSVKGLQPVWGASGKDAFQYIVWMQRAHGD
jgi:hypothetical protein